MIFSDQQVEQLLKGIHPGRIKNDPKGMSYLEQHDVRAHLNRMFGFGNWDQEVTRLDCVFEQPTTVKDKSTGQPKADRWDACYYASVRLTVRGTTHGAAGGFLFLPCCYEDAATGIAQNQSRGEAHDLALKSAVSTALKRAATSLGDQFGLSLYAGTPKAIVKGVIGWEPKPIVAPESYAAFMTVCEHMGLPIEGVEAVFEQRYGKQLKRCADDEVQAFTDLVRGGVIKISVDEPAA